MFSAFSFIAAIKQLKQDGYELWKVFPAAIGLCLLKPVSCFSVAGFPQYLEKIKANIA